MASLATIATVASIGATVVGTGFQIYSSIKAGNDQREALYERAAQEEALGRAEFAAAQRESLERRLEGELILSKQQAAAAASGGGAGADAPTIVRLMTQTADRADYGAKVAQFGGEDRRNTYYRSAVASRRTGDAARTGGYLDAAGSLAGGIGRVAARFPASRFA